MSKKIATQPKPAQQTSQPPAKTAQSGVKSSAKEAPKTAAKGAFDLTPYTKNGVPEEVVQEIKNAFDLFDTDQGGTIDTKGNYFINHRTQSSHGLTRIRFKKRFNFPNDCRT